MLPCEDEGCPKIGILVWLLIWLHCTQIHTFLVKECFNAGFGARGSVFACDVI